MRQARYSQLQSSSYATLRTAEARLRQQIDQQAAEQERQLLEAEKRVGEVQSEREAEMAAAQARSEPRRISL